MTKYLIAAAALMTFAAINAPSARAEVQYPWCAYYGHFGNQATNCGFTSLRQCQATVHGIGGYCDRNPRYRAPRKHRR